MILLQMCESVISPRNMKSVQEWLATASLDEKERFRHIFVGVHRPRDPRFRSAPIERESEAGPRPATSASSRCVTRGGLSREEEEALSRIRARFQEALARLPKDGDGGGQWSQEDVARVLAYGNPGALTDLARVQEASALYHRAVARAAEKVWRLGAGRGHARDSN